MLLKWYQRYKRKLYLKKYNKRYHTHIKSCAKINALTSLEPEARLDGGFFLNTTIGFGTYIGINCNFNNCIIGRFCSTSQDVHILEGKHPLNFVSTYPGFCDTKNKGIYCFDSYLQFDESPLPLNGHRVIIGNDVWIGRGATIKCGVKIEDGAVVGANSLVTKDVPPYSIVGGISAKIIRKENADIRLINIECEDKKYCSNYRFQKDNDLQIETYLFNYCKNKITRTQIDSFFQM